MAVWKCRMYGAYHILAESETDMDLNSSYPYRLWLLPIMKRKQNRSKSRFRLNNGFHQKAGGG